MARPISFCLLAFAFLVFMNGAVASATSSSRTTHGLHQDPSYLKFVSNATDFPFEDHYDYIIIGGGTAGFPLAATLSSKFRVLLMDVNSFDSPVQAFTSEDGVPNVRGCTLGSGSSTNPGSHSPADQEFYKRSSFHWDLKVVDESYEWVERAIVFRPELRKWQPGVPEDLLEAGVDPYSGYTLDHVVGTETGGSTSDTLGRRHSAADLLKHAKPSSIRVAVHATVERVLLAPSTASPNHGEVLLSAGTINGSGRLFLLSGIDPRPHLGSWGIHHIPDAGKVRFGHPDDHTFVSSGSPSRVSGAVFAAAGLWFLWLVHKLCFHHVIELPVGQRLFRAMHPRNPPDPADDMIRDPNFSRSVTVTRTDRPFTRSMARWIVPYLHPLGLGNNQQEDGGNGWPIVPYQAVQQHPPPDVSRAIVAPHSLPPVNHCRDIIVYQPPLQPPVGEPPLQLPVGDLPLQPSVVEPPLQPPVGDHGSRIMMVALLSISAFSLGVLFALYML